MKGQSGWGDSRRSCPLCTQCHHPYQISLQEADRLRIQPGLWLNAVKLPVDRDRPQCSVHGIGCRGQVPWVIACMKLGSRYLSSFRGIVQSSLQGTHDGRMDACMMKGDSEGTENARRVS